MAAFSHLPHQQWVANVLGLGTTAKSAYAHPENAIPAGQQCDWRSSGTWLGLFATPPAGSGAAAFANADHQRNLMISLMGMGAGRFAALWGHPYTVQNTSPAYHAYNFGTPAIDPRINGATPNAGGGTCQAVIPIANLGQGHPTQTGSMILYREFVSSHIHHPPSDAGVPQVNERWTEDYLDARTLRRGPGMGEAIWTSDVFPVGQEHYHGELRPYMRRLNPLFDSALDGHLVGATVAQHYEAYLATLGYWMTDGSITRSEDHGPGQVNYRMNIGCRDGTTALLAGDLASVYLRILGVSDDFANLTGHGTPNAGRISVKAGAATGRAETGGIHSHYNSFSSQTAANSSYAVPPLPMARFETYLYYLIYPVYEEPHNAAGNPPQGNVIGIPGTAGEYALNYPKQLGDLVTLLENLLALGAPGERCLALFFHMAWIADGSMIHDYAGDGGSVYGLEFDIDDLTLGLDQDLIRIFAMKNRLADVLNKLCFGPAVNALFYNGVDTYTGPGAHPDDGPRYRATYGDRNGGPRRSPPNNTMRRSATYAQSRRMVSDPNVSLGGNLTPNVIIAMDRDFLPNNPVNARWFMNRCIRYLDVLGPCIVGCRLYKWSLGKGALHQVPLP